MRTAAAAEAIKNRYYNTVLIVRSYSDVFIRIPFRCTGSFFRREEERTDRRMWTYERALVTTDTFFRIPARYEHGNAAFFFSSRTGRPVAVFTAVKSTDRKVVAFKTICRKSKFLIEVRMPGQVRFFVRRFGPSCGNIDFDDIFKAFVDSRIVLVNNFLTFLAV